MVLDSKVMEWASRQGLDTATLKKAKVPIFGKWYFPDLPANVPLVNLSTGETETFPPGYRAGAVLYVKEEDLRKAGIGPYKKVAAPAPPAEPAAPPPPEPAAAAPVAAAVAAAPARPAAAPRPAAPAPALAAHRIPAPAAHAPAHGSIHGAAAHVAAAHDAHAGHPTPKTYVMIALILCIVTAIEVWVYYIPALLPYIFPILIVLSLFKFMLVVGWFMHLKFDHPSFRLYFAGGLGLSVAIFAGVILMGIGTRGMPPGDGNAHVHPPSMAPATAPAAKPGGH